MIKGFLLPVGLALLTCSISQAGILSFDASGEGGVGITNYTLSINPDGNGSVDLAASQSGSGGIMADVTADLDPTLTLNNIINNDSGFTWTSYGVAISMSQTFTIGPASPTVSNPGWTLQSLIQPVWNGSQYEGQISYVAGTPVPDGQILSFSYQITFSGSASFGQTLTPNPVPEPGTLSLLAGGLLLLVGGRRLIKRS